MLAEEKVLYVESLLESVNNKFKQGPVIGRSLYDQSIIIGQRLDALIENKNSGATSEYKIEAKEPVQ